MNTRLAGDEARSVWSGQQTDISNNEEHGEILFRQFWPDADDEQQMRKLVFSNAFLGRPFDVICPCEQWFGDVVLSPYIKYQPENIQVAIHRPSGRLIGYLTGSLGGQQFEQRQYDMVRRKVISLAVSLTMPWTLFDRASRLFAAHVIFRGEAERPSRPQTGVHWHFQVDKDFRGHGIGTKLLQRFVADAMEAEFELIWAEVTSYPEKPPEYFEDRGWSIYDARATEIFGDNIDFPVQTLCITKPLSSFKRRARSV